MGWIIALVFGVICSLIAAHKGRSWIGWFFIGFFFSLIGLIIVLVVSDLKAQEQRFSNLERENQRLRERVRRDRIVADKQIGHINNRLKAHDRVLNLDTAQQAEEKSLLEYEEDVDAPPPRPQPRAAQPRPDVG